MREALRARLGRYLDEHDVRQAWLEHDRANRQHGERVTAPAPIPPLAVRATVGLGKSHAARKIAVEAQKRGVPVAILVPTRDLVGEYVREINAAGGAATGYQGRQSPPGPDEDSTRWTCWKKEATNEAGERNHRPAQSLCRECKHGRVAETQTGDPERVERAIVWLDKHNIDASKTEPCRFLYEGLPEQLKADLLIAPVQAYSEAIGLFNKPGENAPTQRLIIVDEQVELGTQVPVTAADVGGWIDTIKWLREEIEENDYINAETREAFKKAYAAAAEAADDVMRAILDPDHPISQKRLDDAWRAANAAELVAGGTARWERISYNGDTDKYYIPLRALSAIRASAKAGITRREKGLLHAYELSPVILWAKRKGSVIFLDATLPLTMRSIVESASGEVFDATIDQHMQVVRVTGHTYARGPVRRKGYAATARSAVKDYIEFCKRFTAEHPDRRWAAITHKAHLIYSRKDYDASGDKQKLAEESATALEEKTGVVFGWHGRHSRGHNNWTDRHIAIFGHSMLGHDEEKNRGSLDDAYALDRAALIASGVEGWAEWDGKMQKSDGGIPLPEDANVRAWLLDMYAAELAQTIGRARAANAAPEGPPIQIRLVGGIQTEEMDQALAAHGVYVAGRVPNTVHDSTPGPRGASDAAIAEAIEAIAGRGRRPTRRAVEYWLKQESDAAASRQRIDNAINTWKSSRQVEDPSQRIRLGIAKTAFEGKKVTIDAVLEQLNRDGGARRQAVQEAVKQWKQKPRESLFPALQRENLCVPPEEQAKLAIYQAITCIF